MNNDLPLSEKIKLQQRTYRKVAVKEKDQDAKIQVHIHGI